MLPQVISRNVAARKIDSRYSGAYKSGAGFSPTSISGLQVALDASKITGSNDGDRLTTWTAAFGTTHDATQAGAAGLKPTYETNVQNGLPAVRFDGVDEFLTLGDLSLVFPTAATLFAVFSPTKDDYLVYEHAEVAGAGGSYWRYSGDGKSYIYAFRSARLDAYATAMPATSGGFHVVSLISSASTYNIWLDGADKGAQAAAYQAGTAHNVGGFSGAANYFGGDIAEILIYDSALSAGNRTAVEAYLAAKYAI